MAGRYVPRTDYPGDGYRYITKHGIGPGTLPKDCELLKWEDLPNYKTAIWLDRFLTTEELKEYDIYPEHIQEGVECTTGGNGDKVNIYESLSDDEVAKLAELNLSDDDLGTLLGLFELLKDDEASKTQAMEILDMVFSGKKLVPAEDSGSETPASDGFEPTAAQISERYTRKLLGDASARGLM